ncbi:DMP19 family protein [Chitinolyticbacter albus]|uniref:DMP19 family protein n=1 Tax=Chitinolyticbacter albus TaxID=2961951 RepID=UPI00210C108F|nr:hypothetical protein [Chitinolyticbacter albus]
MQTDPITWACERIEARGFDPLTAPEVDRTVMVVVTAQGLIDNGGFAYLFDPGFAVKPDWNWFVTAYRAIGALETADACVQAIELWRQIGDTADFDALDAVAWQRSASNYDWLATWIKSHRCGL